MRDHKSMKKVIIGTAFAAVALFGTAVSAMAQKDSAPLKPIPLVVDGKPLDADTARNCLSIGYAEGFKRGLTAGKKKSKYDAKSWMPYRDVMFDAPVIPCNTYRPFYDEGYTRGYEDGYNNTTKYGKMTEVNGQTKFAVHQEVMDAIIVPTGI